MTTTLWLRISSIVSLVFVAGHALGGLKHWSPMGENPVLQTMRTVRFETMGVSRSYFDFFVGFGHSLTVMMAMQAILLWQLATIASTNNTVVRPLILVFALATAVVGVIAWRFIFPIPAIFSLILLVCLCLAYFVAFRTRLTSPPVNLGAGIWRS